MTDWKALCAELVKAMDAYDPSDRIATGLNLMSTLDRAHAALAEPVGEVLGPTDEELLSLDQLRDAWNAQADAMNSWDELGIDEIIWWAQRQALARWDRPALVPAGEVTAPHIRRMCDIILGNTFGNEELDSLALLVGHHPDVLNASTVPVSSPLPVAAGEVK